MEFYSKFKYNVEGTFSLSLKGGKFTGGELLSNFYKFTLNTGIHNSVHGRIPCTGQSGPMCSLSACLPPPCPSVSLTHHLPLAPAEWFFFSWKGGSRPSKLGKLWLLESCSKSLPIYLSVVLSSYDWKLISLFRGPICWCSGHSWLCLGPCVMPETQARLPTCRAYAQPLVLSPQPEKYGFFLR